MWQNANIKFDAIITSSAPALQWELFPTNQKNTKVHKYVSSELATPCALYNKTKSQWMTTVGNLSLLKARSTMFSFPTPCEQISLKPKRSFPKMNLQSEISKDIVFGIEHYTLGFESVWFFQDSSASCPQSYCYPICFPESYACCVRNIEGFYWILITLNL